MNRRAFSLMELVVVLVLMGIVAAIALPRFGSSAARATGRSAAERIAADIAWLQAEAVRRQEVLKARFNVGANKINWSRGADVKDPDRPSENYVIMLDERMPGVVLLSASVHRA